MRGIESFLPLWGVWNIEYELGHGSFGTVYKAVRIDRGVKYCSAIKHISIPVDEQQFFDVMDSGGGTTMQELKDYFNEVIEDVQNEINLMYTLRGCTNIVAYEDHMIVPKANGVGADIFIRMELLQGLDQYTRDRQLSDSEKIKLGVDICTALEVCAANGIIHRDIKPSNIFVNARGDFKLGDFGVARVLESSTMGMSKKGTYNYMAPEIFNCEPANLSSDIYSLGLVLYRFFNNSRLPFLPVEGAITPRVNEAALMKRLSGAELRPPCNASAKLSGVILKACESDMRKRYRTPTEFKNELISAVSKGKPEMNRGYMFAAGILLIILLAIGISLILRPNALKDAEGFIYQPAENGYSVVDYEGSRSEVSIPSSFKNKPVTVIGDGAFASRESLVSVVIPATISHIGKEAFAGCDNLSSVTFPEDSERTIHLDSDVFADCGFAEFTIPKCVVEIPDGMFAGCNDLAQVIIPEHVTSIGSGAFMDCYSLVYANISEGVEKIGANAFGGCMMLSFLSIPLSVNEIGEDLFYTTTWNMSSDTSIIYCQQINIPSEDVTAYTYAMENNIIAIGSFEYNLSNYPFFVNWIFDSRSENLTFDSGNIQLTIGKASITDNLRHDFKLTYSGEDSQSIFTGSNFTNYGNQTEITAFSGENCVFTLMPYIRQNGTDDTSEDGGDGYFVLRGGYKDDLASGKDLYFDDVVVRAQN